MTAGLFDDLVETNTTSNDENTPDEAQVTEATSTDNVTSTETTRETMTVESLDSLPAGYVDVKGFAWALTQRNLNTATEQGRTPGPDDMVDTQAVYAATRNKRWSLPSVEAVTSDGTKLGVIIPLEDGLSAWAERPERGTGTGGAGMTPERRATRILRAGKAKANLAQWQKRVARYGELLAEVGASWDDADSAYEQWLETEEAKKEIADSTKENGED